jgi:phage tail-like protein
MAQSAARNDPFTAHHFLVQIDGVTVAGFQECSGLGIEVTVIEYRNGNEQANVRKLPGLIKYQNITLKRGYTRGRELWDWFTTVLHGRAERKAGSISLLAEDRSVAARWEFREAWPCRYEGPVFSARGNDVAIETLELVVESLELEDI